MSQALGPYCPLNQDVTSWNYTEGAAVHLNMEEYERERKSIRKYMKKYLYFNFFCLFFNTGDQCPMNFDDGENPWRTSETYIQTFSFRGSADIIHLSITAILLPLTLLFIVQH